MIDGDRLGIVPREAAAPWVDELTARKAEIIALIQPLAHDPEAWMEDFHRWALDRCVYRHRCFGGIGALCSDFGEWAVAHSSVPCTRQTFERLLTDFGFFFAEGMIYGLILKADLWALEPRPEASPEPMNSRSTRKSPRNLCRKEN